MTDRQINAAIHEALGNPKGCPRCDCANCAYNKGRNYCSDLNAMHEAEKTLANANMYVMEVQLKYVLSAREFYFHASARQRAEAFLRTLDKWEEVQG